MSARTNAASHTDRLSAAVQTMDVLSQDGFGRIKGLALLALLSLETPEGHRSVEALAAALVTICAISDDSKNCINSEAGDVGCSHDEQGWKRRADARRVFQDSQLEGGAA